MIERQSEQTAESVRLDRQIPNGKQELPGQRLPDIVDGGEFDRRVIGNPLPVVALWWAQWCPYCHLGAEILGRLARGYKGTVAAFRIDVDRAPEAVRAHGIRQIPRWMAFRDGNCVSDHTGPANEEFIAALLAWAADGSGSDVAGPPNLLPDAAGVPTPAPMPAPASDPAGSA